ncbi:MAG: NAD-dependent epimerase/dehydratase family protein [Chryseolinea sp.]
MDREPTYVVIGGAGFMGRNFVSHLLKSQRNVIVVGRSTSYDPLGSEQYFSAGPAIQNVLKQQTSPLVIVDFAYTSIPMTSFDDPISDFSSNLLRTIQYLDLAKELNVRRYVYISSGGTVYGDAARLPVNEEAPNFPVSPYGITKLACERYVGMYHHVYGLKTLIIRPSNIYGPYQRPFRGQGFIATALSSASQNQPINVFGDGSTIRDYLYISDFCAALSAAIDTGIDGQIYNIGSSLGITIHDLIDALQNMLVQENKQLAVSFQPGRPYDVGKNVLDSSKLREISLWKPAVDLHQGLKLTWQWLKSGSGV